MRGLQNGDVLRRIHTLFDVGTAAGLTDGELLERYATRGGEAAELAFAALVERHGPIVYRVCRRMLRDPHDAQDAFQAAFLVLVRKAHSIRNRNSVGSWLYGVAVRVSSDSRAAASRRRAHERNAALEQPRTVEKSDQAEAVLEEVGRLPEKYRVPVVLCALEGFTCEEVARQLAWPIGTVRSRLTRGKERLKTQLTRRGMAPSAGLVAAVLRVPTEAIPPAVLGSTLRTALAISTGRGVAETVSAHVAALSAGVLRSMFMSKLKFATGVLLTAGLVAGGAGVLAQQGSDPNVNPAAGVHGARYEIRVIVDGKPSGEPIIAEVEDGQRITFGTPSEMIQIHRKTRAEATGSMLGAGLSRMASTAQPVTETNGARNGNARDARKSSSAKSANGNPQPGAGGSMMGMMAGMGGGMPGMASGGGMPGVPGDAPESGMMGSMAGRKVDPPGEKQSEPRMGRPGGMEAGMSGGGMPGMAGMMMRGGGNPGMAGGPPVNEQESRIREVERKLDEILKRLEDRKTELSR